MRVKRIHLESGFQVEMLTVLEQLEDKNKRTNFLCKCSCGRTVEVLGKCLTAKKPRKSCGCLIPMMSRVHSLSDEKNLVGFKFDMLTVLERDFTYFAKDSHTSYYRCLCECGNEKIVSRKVLLNKHRKSCGCLHKKVKEEFFLKYCTKKPKKVWTKDSKKFCNSCKKELSIFSFYKKLDNFSAKCKNCMKLKDKA